MTGNQVSGSARRPPILARAIADQRQAAPARLEARCILQQAIIRQAEADLAAKTAGHIRNEDAVRYPNLAANTSGPRQIAERVSAVDEEGTLSHQGGRSGAMPAG